ncbi:hypothetical protein [Acuticoccus sp.]|uniref:hypothetical protein n=1 Tax=Acuticoccus sp. TaxID=1904378 RepID=UPI003B527BB6
MDISSGLVVPGLIVGAVLLFVVLALFARLGGRSRLDVSAQEAALQAEKDVLRANHAVEVAALEHRLAEALTRSAAAGAGAVLGDGATPPADRARAGASTDVDALNAEVAALKRREADQGEAIASLKATLAAADRSAAERDAPASDELTAARSELVQAMRERDQLREQLANRTDADASSDVAELRVALAERDGTIAELRAALEPRAADEDDGAEVTRLTAALHAVGERERLANGQLSRLAYELEGLRGTVRDHERIEGSLRTEIERREALLELRLQKVYAIEERLREQSGELRALAERAEAAEAALERAEGTAKGDGVAVTPTPDAKVHAAALEEALARAAALEGRLEKVRAENGTLLQELEALRRHAGEPPAEAPALAEELAAARADLAALAQENERLRAARGPALDEASLAPLRAALRDLADRFLREVEGEASVPEVAEPSLAERIRAFKAARAKTDA